MNALLTLKNLTQQETYHLFAELSDHNIAKQAACLALLRAKPETTAEVLGAMQYFEQYSHFIQHDMTIVDIVGTGGDGKGTFNISTAASIVMASCGCLVAKHGGKSAANASGSQCCAQALKLPMATNASDSIALLKQSSYVYLWAPLFNEKFKAYGPIRKMLGFPTIFNLLGPLLNPMKPKRCLMGVYRYNLMQTMATLLTMQGVQQAMVVHSEDGLDEISISGITHVMEIKDGFTQHYTIQPEDFGIRRARLSDVKGGDVSENAAIVQNILSGELKGPKLDIVLLNAAAGLYVAGKVASIIEGFSVAQHVIASGKAQAWYANIQDCI
jgi:anthranilate phosphoribosyltransferase